MAQDEFALQRLLQGLEGIEKEDHVFAAESAAWVAALAINEYVAETEPGSRIRLTIHGNPYVSSIDHDPALVAGVKSAYHGAIADGLQALRRERPTLDGVLFNNPFLDSEETRSAYMDRFNEMLEVWGFRSISELGARHYLEQVPDHMDYISFQAPDGSRTMVNSGGYITEGLDIEIDPDRPYSQRGVHPDRPRSREVVKRISQQLGHLAAHRDRFTFDASDLLGYRPLPHTSVGYVSVWQGWEQTEV
jgi:hypothetical protein